MQTIETAAQLATELERVASLLMKVDPEAARRTLRRAKVLRSAPPDVDGWAWLAQRGDRIARVVCFVSAKSGSGTFPAPLGRRSG